ncbi:MAG: Acetyl-coenzyme A synthetase [Acidimicrobiales bacterium AG-410-I20]|nr:MAG: Acetyl-coenzyme A synthetase [Acidimicrobiales bacterium AG-410-I20]
MRSFCTAANVPETELHNWSIRNPAEFWDLVWNYFQIIGERGEGPSVSDGSELYQTEFFNGASLNYAENLLKRSDHEAALIFESENKTSREVSWGELNNLVSQLQQALLSSGIRKGDRVAAWLPNGIEIYAVMLASASIGAVFSSVSPDFGSRGVIDRFKQIDPKILFTISSYQYGGREFDLGKKIVEVVNELPTINKIVVVSDDEDSLPQLKNCETFNDFYGEQKAQEVHFVSLPFDHPLYILYSSGTTGAPKCIAHRAGGLLLKHLVEHRLHCDVRSRDRLFYFTTAGWMMWNWLAAGLSAEATLVLYDGSPFYPDASRLFDLIDETQITLFGVSAKFIDSVSSAGLRPIESHELKTLRTVCSTGSPLSPESFSHIYRDWKNDVHLASISGGTDLCGCLVGGNPTSPVFAGQIQGPILGQDMDVVDSNGSPADVGVPGELVCKSAFPSMPIGFWEDPGDLRYKATYFEKFPGFWHQGDFAEKTVEGGFIIHGRSDATLNPGGVRIGTAEIYRRVDAFDEVLESLAVGQNWNGDVRIVLFVVMADGFSFDDDLKERVCLSIRNGASPRHVPSIILSVPDLPRTRSGKLVELAVKNVIQGLPVTNIESLVNPDSLENFRDLPELN